MFPTHAELENTQTTELGRLLGGLHTNPFWAPRLEGCGLAGEHPSLDAFRARMPFTTKAELADDQKRHPPYGTNLTRPLADYVRVHQTSSTTGAPLRWLDTPEGWEFLKRGWKEVLTAAGVTAEDRVFVAFSFGPFIGLWLAFEAAQELGALAIPGGALSSQMRLQAILANEATVLCCTPTYALRLVEVAAELKIDLSTAHIRSIIVGGEPGGGVPAVRERIERAWPGARLLDHYGLTEAGSITYACPARPGVMHVAESLYLAEVVEPSTGEAITFDGQTSGELVVTTLGRGDSPVLRYRTADIVCPLPRATCACGRAELALAGGVLGRVDDMVHVRGVNLFPSAVDAIVGGSEDVAEYRVRIRTERGMTELDIDLEPKSAEIETHEQLRQTVEEGFQRSYGLRVAVHIVAPGSLPRFEFKARRWVRE